MRLASRRPYRPSPSQASIGLDNSKLSHFQTRPSSSNRNPLHRILHSPDPSHQIARLVASEANCHNRAADATGPSKCHFTGHINERHVLVFAQEWKMKRDGEGLGVAGHDDELGGSSVQRFGCFIGALLDLVVVGCLLDEVQ